MRKYGIIGLQTALIGVLSVALAFGAGFFEQGTAPSGGYPSAPTFTHVGTGSVTATDNISGTGSADLKNWRNAYINNSITGAGSGAISGYYVGSLKLTDNTALDNLVDGSYSATIKPKNVSGDNTGLLNNFANFMTSITNDANFGPSNVRVGYDALMNPTYGSQVGAWNTAVGYEALMKNTDGTRNTGVGYEALRENLVGSFNTAVGQHALQNTTGSENTGIGQGALLYNTSGEKNTAVGLGALQSKTAGDSNTGVGYKSMYQSDGGIYNTAVGASSLQLVTGDFNTAIGRNALVNVTSGASNIGIGYGAGPTTGTLNSTIAIGSGVVPTLEGEIIIGASNGIGSGTTVVQTTLRGDVKTGSTFSGGTPVYIVADNTVLTRSAHGNGSIVVMNDVAGKIITLPEITPYPSSMTADQVLIGASYTIQVWGARSVFIKPHAGEAIRLSGGTSELAAGVGITNDNTAGSEIRLVAYGWDSWLTMAPQGTWVSE